MYQFSVRLINKWVNISRKFIFMKKSCKHHYWSPMPRLNLCYKCGDKIVTSYSEEQLKAMYASQYSRKGDDRENGK